MLHVLPQKSGKASLSDTLSRRIFLALKWKCDLKEVSRVREHPFIPRSQDQSIQGNAPLGKAFFEESCLSFGAYSGAFLITNSQVFS